MFGTLPPWRKILVQPLREDVFIGDGRTAAEDAGHRQILAARIRCGSVPPSSPTSRQCHVIRGCMRQASEVDRPQVRAWQRRAAFEGPAHLGWSVASLASEAARRLVRVPVTNHGQARERATSGESMAVGGGTGIPCSFTRRSVLVSAEFDLPPETRCPASMPEDTSDDVAASTSDTCFELHLGKWGHFRVGDVSERVQLEVVRGLVATALATLVVHAISVIRSPRPVDEPAPSS